MTENINFRTEKFNEFLTETGKLFANAQWGDEGGKGGAIPRAPNHYGGAESLRGRRMTA